MREDNLLCVKRLFGPRTTDSNHGFCVYPNLAKDLEVTGFNQLWVADITYIRLTNEFIYLAVIIDLFSRKCVGWELERNIDTQLTLNALDMALSKRGGTRLSGLVHHSDRGVQYAANDYIDRLKENGIRISMSRKGNPYDNAFAESFIKTVKYEEVYLREYESYDEAKRNIKKFIEEVYNEKRIHSSIGYLTPEEFEMGIILNRTTTKVA
jgi:transposase InsO family protein